FAAALSAVGVIDSTEGFARTVEALVAQTDTRWEWCVVCGPGSVPGLAREVSAFIAAEPRIRVFDASDAGWADALAVAVDLSSGRHLLYLGGGDSLEPDFVALVRRTRMTNPGCTP